MYKTGWESACITLVGPDWVGECMYKTGWSRLGGRVHV